MMTTGSSARAAPPRRVGEARIGVQHGDALGVRTDGVTEARRRIGDRSVKQADGWGAAAGTLALHVAAPLDPLRASRLADRLRDLVRANRARVLVRFCTPRSVLGVELQRLAEIVGDLQAAGLPVYVDAGEADLRAQLRLLGVEHVALPDAVRCWIDHDLSFEARDQRTTRCAAVGLAKILGDAETPARLAAVPAGLRSDGDRSRAARRSARARRCAAVAVALAVEKQVRARQHQS